MDLVSHGKGCVLQLHLLAVHSKLHLEWWGQGLREKEGPGGAGMWVEPAPPPLNPSRGLHGLAGCGGLNNGPQRCPRPSLQNPGMCYITQKRGFTDVIKSGALRWEMTLDYLGGPNVITRVLVRGRQSDV